MKKLIAIISFLIVGIFIFSGDESNIETTDLEEKPVVQSKEKIASKRPLKLENDKTVALKKRDVVFKQPKDKQESLGTFVKAMNNFMVSNNKKELVKVLEDLELSPKTITDSNQYTGAMSIIRTNNSLPGTRYFHAQYTGNDQENQILQHMSFEYEPSESSFEDVKKEIQKVLAKNRRPSSESSEFVSWDLDSGHIVWIKKMDEQDLSDNPFNAYSPDDKGTIKVTLELEIH